MLTQSSAESAPPIGLCASLRPSKGPLNGVACPPSEGIRLSHLWSALVEAHLTNVSFLILSTRPHGLCSDPTSFSSLSTHTHLPIKSSTLIHTVNGAHLSTEDGVLNLAGEFVHNFYHTVVGKDFADAVHLYKDAATASRGTEGTRATTSTVRVRSIILYSEMLRPQIMHKRAQFSNWTEFHKFFAPQLLYTRCSDLSFSLVNLVFASLRASSQSRISCPLLLSCTTRSRPLLPRSSRLMLPN